MAVTLTATLEPERLAVRLNVGGIPAGADTYTIERTSPSGHVAGVRGAVDAALGGAASAIARDFEAPLDLPLSYRVTAYDGTTAVGTKSVAFQIGYLECQAWLVDLARPTNSLQLTIESLAALQFDSAAGVHRVLNRRAPVMTTLPAWTPAGELIVLTETLGERDQVRALMGSGYPLLVRTTPDLGIGNLYLGLTGFVEERFLSDGYAAQRRFRAACVQVERPDPAIYVPTAPNTYAQVAATWASYAALKAGVGTYDELAYTYSGGAVGPVPPWLPDDV